MLKVAFWLLVGQTPVINSSKPPLEAHATLEGQDALAANAGTLGFQEGFGFTYRHVGPPRDGNTDTFLAAYSPVSFLTLGLGIEYARYDGSGHRFVQGSMGIGLRPTTSLSFGLIYRPFVGVGGLQGLQLSAWDFGLAYRPARWLSLTGAIENFSQPVSGDYYLPRIYALGAAFRPFRNDWLTVGADVRLRETADLTQWPAPRFTVDVRPLSWLGVMVSATTRGEIFAGLSLRARYAQAGGGIGLSPASGVQSSYAFGRIHTTPREGLHFGGKKTVQLGLRGDLRPRESSFFSILMSAPQYGEIPLELHALAERDDVAGIRLVFQGLDVGFATLEEIRDAIAYLRKKGKVVVAELGDADDRDLFVASAADKIVMEPEASLRFDGLKVTLRTFKGTLDKLGARVEAQQSGEYKNSPDAFTKDAPTAPQLEAQNALLDSAFAHLKAAVMEGRQMDEKKVDALLGRAIFTAQQAKDAGLIDELSYDPDPRAPLPGSRYDNLANAGTLEVKRHEWNQPPAIALVAIEGTITSGESFEDPFDLFPIAGSGTIVRALEQARLDDDIKAVVVRINSPGGDILASDFIWQAMRRVQATKPLIVSMGDTAASGGYYAALPADVIFAQPDTVTGSIGVFSLKVDLSGLFDKIGIKHMVLLRGDHADALDMTRGLTPEEQALQMAHVQELYQAFLRKVGHARKIDDPDAIARGRVWTGQAALERKLVDRLGGLVDAIAEAKKRAGYKDATVVDIRPFPSFGSPLHRYAAEVSSKLGLGKDQPLDLGKAAEFAGRVMHTFDGRALYLMPEGLSVR